jgi:hypothetical protein
VRGRRLGGRQTVEPLDRRERFFGPRARSTAEVSSRRAFRVAAREGRQACVQELVPSRCRSAMAVRARSM